MEKNFESLEFKNKISNVQYALRTLKEKGLINTVDATDYLLASYSARTLKDAEEITSELAKVCQGQHSDPRALRKRLSEGGNHEQGQ